MAVEPVDFRKGIDGLVAVCRQRLQAEPMNGALIVFRSRRARSLKILAYDGQGFLLCCSCTGENLDDVLQHRDKERPPPLQMCDGLARNEPKVGTTTLACCLAHGRRGFVDVAADFPERCRYVLERVRTVYGVDAETKARGLSPAERLRLHQSQSQPVMEELHTWLEAQLRDKRVEPKSGLGEAIEYMLGHWVQLTRFLHEPEAPLENNLCERIWFAARRSQKWPAVVPTRKAITTFHVSANTHQALKRTSVNARVVSPERLITINSTMTSVAAKQSNASPKDRKT